MVNLHVTTKRKLGDSFCLQCGDKFTKRRKDQRCCKLECTLKHHADFYRRKVDAGLCGKRECTNKARDGGVMCVAHAVEANIRRVVYTRSYKEQALDAYGGRFCAGCGEDEFCCLSIDHIAQDGHEYREEQGTGTALYQWLKRNKYPGGFRVLCMNCQFRARAGVPFPCQTPVVP